MSKYVTKGTVKDNKNYGNNRTGGLAPRFVRDIIKQHQEEYHKADRKQKKVLLDNLERVTLRPRKSIIRTLNTMPSSFSTEVEIKQHIPGARGRPIVYTPEVKVALEDIWQAYDCPCAERLHPQIPAAIAVYKRHGQWHYSDKVESLLLAMSLSAMRNILVVLAKKHHLMRGISTTRASHLKELVPTFHGSWADMPVGYGQVDTVVHSGGFLSSPMVYTVNFIDMQTYWQEFYAQLEKTDDATKASLIAIEKRLPFPLVGLHPDSGDEFLNWLVFNWCRNKELHFSGKIELTRSRPNKKNDNCNVEERNNAIIRKYIGYERYDCIEAVDAMNELYEVLRLYVNYFQPIQKLIGKKRKTNGKYRRIYDGAMTPYERVLAHPNISQEVKDKLTYEYEALNPKRLLVRIKALTIKLQRIQQALGYHG